MNETFDELIPTSSFSSSTFVSSTAIDRKRNVVNAIYIAGIAFMIGVFLILLWVNLFSRHCWCWHNTSVINRVNRRWLMQQSSNEQNIHSSSKNRHNPEQIPTNDPDSP